MHPAPENEAADRLIVALDVASYRQALEIVDRLDGSCHWFKVGMELYYAAGRQVVDHLVRQDYRVFLDLKLHDIPATVAGAVRSVADTGASLLTVHAGGGQPMMEAAAEAANHHGGPRLLAVTVLTSMDAPQMVSVGLSGSPATQVLRLAHLAERSGITGLVCSAEETSPLRNELGTRTLLVVPGIRPTGAELGDQRRVATPAKAIRSGASMLVVGRPITRAPDPAAAARSILLEMAAGTQDLSPRAQG